MENVSQSEGITGFVSDGVAGRSSGSYPSARLKLGMAAVGFMTMAAVVALVTGFAGSLTGMIRNAGLAEVMVFPVLALMYAAIMLVFDIAGGFVLPEGSGIGPHTTPANYLKAVLVHGLMLSVSMVIIHTAGSLAGFMGSLGAILILCTVAIAFQYPLALLVGSHKEKPLPAPSAGNDFIKTTYVESRDHSFSGSITGLPGRERILLPAQWENSLGESGMSTLLARRMLIVKMGWRNRGLALALMWVCGSWTAAALIVGFPDGTVATTLNQIFLSSVFHFLGLLTLPTPTRNMTLLVDRHMKNEPGGTQDFQSWVQRFSDLTDGEKNRHPWIERIFHPLPSVQSRLSGTPSGWAAWNATRTMLYLSIFTGGLLWRAVHCNVGRPDLWIIAPTD